MTIIYGVGHGRYPECKTITLGEHGAYFHEGGINPALVMLYGTTDIRNWFIATAEQHANNCHVILPVFVKKYMIRTTDVCIEFTNGCVVAVKGRADYDL